MSIHIHAVRKQPAAPSMMTSPNTFTLIQHAKVCFGHILEGRYSLQSPKNRVQIIWIDVLMLEICLAHALHVD